MELKEWKRDPHNPNKSLPLLILLWKKFLTQPIRTKIITLAVIVITVITLVVFYTSFIMWQIFCFVLGNTVLRGVEWYLRKDADIQN